jgi:hypothetical protein
MTRPAKLIGAGRARLVNKPLESLYKLMECQLCFRRFYQDEIVEHLKATHHIEDKALYDKHPLVRRSRPVKEE